jgi:fatty acid desaturase
MAQESQTVFKGSAMMRRPVIEWPTVTLAVGIYASWLLLTAFHASLPSWLLFLLGGAVIAWHSSFQHEVVHGHPTRFHSVNIIFGFPPLSLWLPFELYRTSHRLHHKDDRLTDPLDDPESKYFAHATWQQLSSFEQLVETIHTPLIGRVLLGPFLMIGRFLWAEISSISKGNFRHARVWLVHLFAVSLLLGWLNQVCKISLLDYLFYFVYPGTAILVLRSFAEHRAATDVPYRTAIVENASLFGLLFLNNNLHAVHHRFPGASWYVLPKLYRLNRDIFLNWNGSLVYNGYGEIIAKFLFRKHDDLVHPFAMPAEPKLCPAPVPVPKYERLSDG